MANDFLYSKLKESYGDFQEPIAIVKVADKDLSENQETLQITDISIINSAGFEASTASFTVYGAFDKVTSLFKQDLVAASFPMGAVASIALGYATQARTVFIGYITQLNFIYNESGIPGVKVTCMDIKAAMMTKKFNKQIPNVTCYSDAVKKVLESYKSFQKTKPAMIKKLSVFDTPDKPAEGDKNKETATTIEYVNETDYEFCVKAAKKFNYEFFCYAGEVIFRAAKSNTTVLIDLASEGIKDIDVEFNSVGIAEFIEVKSIDPGSGKLISYKAENKNKKALGIKAGTKTIIDPSVTTQKDAQYRAEYHMEENMYKYGTLKATFVGLPELTPGRFIRIKFMDNDGFSKFYVHEVTHEMDGDSSFTTSIVARGCMGWSETEG